MLKWYSTVAVLGGGNEYLFVEEIWRGMKQAL